MGEEFTKPEERALSSQDDPETLESPEGAARETGTNDEANPPDAGPPRTAGAIATFVVTVLLGFGSWLFKLWDRSDFPETFAHPAYWLLMGLILLIGGVWAFWYGNRRRWFDFAIIEALFLAAAVTFVMSSYVYRQAKPSDKIFTIVLFGFTDHTTPANVAESLRENLNKKLEEKYKGEILVRERDRLIKGETFDETARVARRWATRGAGCHLAVWVDLFTAADGESYDVKLHWVSVSPFGGQLHHTEVDNTDELDVSLKAKSTGAKGAVDEDTVKTIANYILTFYGTARFDRGDYDGAMKVLSDLPVARAQYFTGRAAIEKATTSTNARELF